MDLAGVELDGWDYATFAAFVVIGGGFLGLLVLVLGLPGRIAVARNHPEADAVNLMGWIGSFTIFPWAQALIWAFKPTDVIDVRRWPEEVRRATAEMIEKMKHHPAEKPTPAANADATSPGRSATPTVPRA